MNISSLVVRTDPAAIDQVVAAIGRLDHCEIQFRHARGRIVVTIEADTSEQERAIFERIRALKHVLSADLVFSYEGEIEDEA